jgi:hypothetical protein
MIVSLAGVKWQGLPKKAGILLYLNRSAEQPSLLKRGDVMAERLGLDSARASFA